MEEEQKWIRDIQRRGSRQAADKLVRTYYDEIYRFAYRQLGHKEDAMDLTQTIFLAVLRALPSFDGRKASFRTRLYRIAAYKAIDCRRKVQGNILLLEETETPDQTDFAAQIQDRDLLDRMEEYISRLDPDTQAVYRLRLYGERTFPEIAAVLGQPEAAVKTRYYRLMARLRKEFG
ncbi:RNA polymerase sigma factor [uncultured Flavonifractor sp.]|uniref:RNA polymerase sigma factor n=1 Tax=uncultured Flavonifractor sp. TaxID=1193534 RepID=UPI00261C6947|nr:sigma-70 family RNA polymerase sigma factor [uncultured Flavonifractor sp.]